ncbi:hypothetical protein [Kitasatospora herbaricolor]|uniref:Uncharacterized protein n=1 Tax=Kitasatospora herbaricolor TaxID=68217 RepID=A0ABZ1W2W9_9ACTN|nr:hypothetical protein [Kitasatospora herbaricolor]
MTPAGHRLLQLCSLTLAAGAVGLLALAACGSAPAPDHAAHSGMPAMPAMPAMPGMPGMEQSGTATPGTAPSGMPGMAGMTTDEGLTAQRDGYRLDSPATELPAGVPVSYPFTITGPDGRPVTDFAEVQTEKLHFYAIRADLTGYQHLHPTMAADGTWTADPSALTPGDWRLYASFTPNTGPRQGKEFVLGRTVTVPGAAAAVPLPAVGDSATVDGWTATVQGELTAGKAGPLTVTISRDGRPVTDLQPYLASYAHLSAFHQGDQALAHLHPITPVAGDHGGPTLTFYALLGRPGNWRVFLQFRTAGQVHTAELTLHVA